MIRLRAYKPCDAKSIVSWCDNETVFNFWGGLHFGKYPITSEIINDKYFNKNLVYTSHNVRMIGVCIPINNITCKEKKAFIGMRFNNWRNEGGWPYDWYVLFDGEDINIYIDDRNEISTVKDMISKAVYDKKEDYVIMPIFNKRSYYTKHNYTKPMKALAFFADHIEDYCTEFFNEAKNITLK